VSPTDNQTAFRFDAKERTMGDTTQLYALFGAMVRAAGGLDALVAALDREPSYHSKISEAMNRRDGRHVHLDWLAPLLADEDAATLLMDWLSDRLGYEPPVRKRAVSEEEEMRAAREVIREMPEPLKDAYRREMAKKLGIRPEDLKL
jgi:hypothetical protein